MIIANEVIHTVNPNVIKHTVNPAKTVFLGTEKNNFVLVFVFA